MAVLKNPFNSGFKVTSPYGERTLNGKKQNHTGIDIVGLSDKNVRSVTNGEVIVSRIITDKSNPTWQWGNYVCIKGEDGKLIYYCHLSSRNVSKGERIHAGDIIGIMGNTGYSFGAHTHFEVRDGSLPINAADYLGIKNECGEYNLLDIPSQKTDEIPSIWASEAIEWAKNIELLRGDGSCYKPKEPCSREEAVTLLYRLYTHLQSNNKGENHATDN